MFYRLNVFPISLPPLRDRHADILPLAEHFVKHSANNLGLPAAPGLSAKVQSQLMTYTYPGNVRELKNIIERALLLSDFETINQIELGEIPEEHAMSQVSSEPELITAQVKAIEPTISDVDDAGKSLKQAVSDYERTVIIDCLNTTNWQMKRTAEQLSLPLSTLNHKMKKYDISIPK